jgi:8-oxo-dGTP diphosphatase
MGKPGVLGVVFNRNKSEVLLVKRRDVPIWVFPGGGIEIDESPEEAVRREVWEETGLRVDIIKKIAFYTPLNRLSHSTHLFECRPIDGLLRTSCESQDVAYFKLDQLPKDFFIVHSDWLQDALLNHHETLQLPIWRVTYLELFKYFCRHPIHVIKFMLSRS